MREFAEIEYLDFEKNEEYEKVVQKVLTECFKVEVLDTHKPYSSTSIPAIALAT